MVVGFLVIVEASLLEFLGCMAIVLFNVIVVAYSCLHPCLSQYYSLSFFFGVVSGMENRNESPAPPPKEKEFVHTLHSAGKVMGS